MLKDDKEDKYEDSKQEVINVIKNGKKQEVTIDPKEVEANEKKIFATLKKGECLDIFQNMVTNKKEQILMHSSHTAFIQYKFKKKQLRNMYE
jgi:hypothetical protein